MVMRKMKTFPSLFVSGPEWLQWAIKKDGPCPLVILEDCRKCVKLLESH